MALKLSLQTASHGSYVLPVTLTNLVPAAIPIRFDNNSSLVIPSFSTGTRTFPVTGISTPVARVEVSFYITNIQDDVLDIYLRSPDGTRVELTTDNGGTGDNYGTNCTDPARTRFSDLAASSVTTGAAPFVGTYRPEGSLATFNGKSGVGVNGSWLLEVIVDSSIAVPVTLNCASLFIYPAECATGSGLCELCPDNTIFGVVGAGNPTHSFALVTNGVASACGTPKVCPGTLPTGLTTYSLHTFRAGLADACVTATLTAPDANLDCVIYTNFFDPGNICLNYLADVGLRAGPGGATRACSFNIGSNQTFHVVLSGSGAYSLALSGGDCRPRMGLAAFGANKAVIDWTTAAPGFVLECTNQIPSTPTHWPRLTNIPAVVNGRYQVTNSPAGPNQFYRLRRPLP